MVEKSIYQIKSETFKALIAINLSKSLADDCSNLCCNLAKIKIPFLKDLITLLERNNIEELIYNDVHKEVTKNLIAPFYGLNLIEYLSSENINWSGNVIAPNYLISAMLTYNFENGQSIQINPSNLGEKIIYNNSQFTFFEIKKDYVSYGINIDF